jgi:cytochrome c553
MRQTFLAIVTIVIVVTTVVISCDSNSTTKSANNTTTLDSSQRVKRGEYLVSIGGCDDCHSPKKMGEMGPEIIPELRLSGYPASKPIQKLDSNVIKQGWIIFGPDMTNAVGPWGMSFAANITNDYTGIANWTEENFITALKKGKFKGLEGSRDLLPPMPWQSYKNMTDEDIKSIFAYLKTTKPVENIVPAPKQFADLK